MVSRIKQLLDWQQLSPTQFADRIGVGRPVVSHILSERNKPSLEVVQRILTAFPNLAMPWLLTGSGPMLAPEAAAIPTPKTATPPSPSSVVLPPASTATGGPALVAEVPAATAAPIVVAELAPPITPRPLATRPPALARFQGAATPPRAAPPAPVGIPPGPVATEPIPPAPVLAPPPAPGASLVATPAPAMVADAFPASAQAAPADITALAGGLGEPGKAIRRIVIFYRDGSFADYQPEL